MMKNFTFLLIVLTITLFGCSHVTTTQTNKKEENKKNAQKNQIKLSSCAKQIKTMRAESNKKNLKEKYKDLELVDVSNHDANQYEASLPLWDDYHLDKIAISGYVSRESSVLTDELAWKAFSEYPQRFYPFFSGIDIFHKNGIELAHKNLEQGFMGIGQIAAPSLVSPFLTTAEWKGKDPMDGNLPEIYKLAGQYKVPVLIHMDPPSAGIEKFEEALNRYPSTTFIYGQSNVANNPNDIDEVMKKHKNLYFDFFAGYTAYNPRDPNKLKDYVKLIEKYSDRALLSTDSGVELKYKDAILAMYEMIDMLSPETACKVSHENFMKLMKDQPVTKTQLKKIKSLSKKLGERYEEPKTKLEANQLIFELSNKIKPAHKEYFTDVPSSSSVKNKSFTKLNQKDMVSISRDLITRMNVGLWDINAEIQAKTEWDSFYYNLFLPDGLSETRQQQWQGIDQLNSYNYKLQSFQNESVTKHNNYFIYSGETKEIYEDPQKTDDAAPTFGLYRVWITVDPKFKTYKIKKELDVELKK
jgi:predicted TIM-barrel fold metal-dependent hydrolase